MNKTWLIALAILILGGAGALYYWRSGTAASALPSTEPYLVGQVTQYVNGRILVEAVPGKQEGNKCWFAVTAQTRIFRQEGGAHAKADSGALAVGQQVQAWTTGPILESYPCQTGADAILILAR